MLVLVLVAALRQRGTLPKLRAKQHCGRRTGELKIFIEAATGRARSRRRRRSRRSGTGSIGCIACCRLQCLQWQQAGQLHEALGVRMCRSQRREGVATSCATASASSCAAAAVTAEGSLVCGHWRYLRQMLEFSILAADHASHAEQIVTLVATRGTTAAVAAMLGGRTGCAGCARRKGEVDIGERQLIGG